MVTAELQLATLRQWLTTCQTENIHTALHIETSARSLVSCTVTMVDIRMKMISCLTWMGMREMPSGFMVTNHLSVYAAHSQVLQCCKVLFSSATHIAASNLKETIPNYYESKLLSKLIKRTIMFVVCIGYWSNCNQSYCSSNFCGGHEGDCSIDIGVCRWWQNRTRSPLSSGLQARNLEILWWHQWWAPSFWHNWCGPGIRNFVSQ